MALKHQTLKCAECGSSYLELTGLNQYRCQHCGSVSVVEDNVSDRLDRVLDQVKDAAAQRLAQEEAARQTQQRRIVAIALGVVTVSTLLFVMVIPRLAPSQRTGVPTFEVGDRSIPTDGLKFVDPRQVLVGKGSSARPQLLVTVRNETGRVLQAPRVEVAYFNGDTPVETESGQLPAGLMLPGEAWPLLLRLPSDKPVTRQVFKVDHLREARAAVPSPKLSLARARLVEEDGALRMVGRLVNASADLTLSGLAVLVTAYDASGAPVAVGTGSVRPSPLRPGERGAVEARLDRFGGSTPIAGWDYRIDHDVLDAGGQRASAVPTERTVRVAGAPESFDPDLHITTEDLLAEDSERFDLQQLELLPLIPGVNNIRQRTYMTELINRSTDKIAITPSAVISRYDGHKLDGKTRLEGIAYVYPGERIPVQVDPDQADDISQTRIEWKPLRSAPLPGPRTPLEVKVTSTEAKIGNVTVNFSQRFSYKAALVKGVVRNPGATIVRKPKLWVSLRDKKGKLTGFKVIDNLPAIGAGDSVPFEAIIQQQGADYATVSTAYQSTE